MTMINYSSCLSRICSLFLTPKNLVNLNLIIMSLSKFFYMCYDPYCQHKRASYQFDRIINGLSISSIISIYLLLFIVFVGLNANLHKGSKIISKKCYICVYKTLKTIIITLLFFIYPIQIFISYSTSTVEIHLKYLIYLYIGFCFLFFILYCFIFYILLYLKKKLLKYSEMKNNFPKNELKVDVLENENTNLENENNTNIYEDDSKSKLFFQSDNLKLLKKKNDQESKTKKQIIDFLTNTIKEKKLDTISYILGRNDEEKEFEKNDDKIYFENEMKMLNNYNPDYYDLNQNYTIKYTYVEQKTETFGQRKKTLLIKKTIKKPKLSTPNINDNNYMDGIFIMNENDKELVNNIFHYSYLYMIFTVFYLFCFIISKINYFISIDWVMFIIYFFMHLIDCFYIIIIYFVFFKNSSSQEYENLKYIGELEKLIKGKFLNGKIKLMYDDLANSCIADRFKGFITFDHENYKKKTSK